MFSSPNDEHLNYLTIPSLSLPKTQKKDLNTQIMLCYSFVSHQGVIVSPLVSSLIPLSYPLAFHRAEGSSLLLPGAPPPVEPEACAASSPQRPTPGSLSPPLAQQAADKKFRQHPINIHSLAFLLNLTKAEDMHGGALL